MKDKKIEKLIDGRLDVIKQCVDAAIEYLVELKSNTENVSYLRYLNETKETEQP